MDAEWKARSAERDSHGMGQVRASGLPIGNWFRVTN